MFETSRTARRTTGGAVASAVGDRSADHSVDAFCPSGALEEARALREHAKIVTTAARSAMVRLVRHPAPDATAHRLR
jgi:hypothetical protein